jgi:D-3-phosphoglycerate dehydrogenase
MNECVEPLIRDLLEWLAREERSYADTMDAWRTSCPRLPVWEEANERGLVARVVRNGKAMIELTGAGRSLLAAPRPRA